MRYTKEKKEKPSTNLAFKKEEEDKMQRKEEMLKNFRKKEQRQKASKIIDQYEKWKYTKIPQATDFLGEKELEFFHTWLASFQIDSTKYTFHPMCERNVLLFGRPKEKPVICFEAKQKGSIRHPDVLGTLFAQGLKQEVMGDIFVEQDKINIIVKSNVAKAVERIDRIGKEPIRLYPVDTLELKETHFQSLSLIVPSLRLDAVLSHLLHLSRTKVDQLYQQKQILLNDQEVKNRHTIIKENDVLSIRHYGKFRIKKEELSTRKGNRLLKIDQYK